MFSFFIVCVRAGERKKVCEYSQNCTHKLYRRSRCSLLFTRQVFRLAGHGLFSPSRTEVQWQIENILSAYGDGFTEDSHLIPYSPIRFGSAPETIIFHNIAQKAEGCQGGSAFSAEQDPLSALGDSCEI